MQKIIFALALAISTSWLAAGLRRSGGEEPPYGLDRLAPVDTSPVMGSPDPIPPLEIERAFPKLRFDKPLQLTHAGDGTDRVFVCTQRGVIYVFPNRPDAADADRRVFLDLSGVVAPNGPQSEEGLMSIAFHPRYRENGLFFVYYTVRPLASVVDRFRVSPDDPNRADPQSRQEILRFDQPFANHNGGSMQFGPDGYLYIGLGDGGSRDDPHNNAQNLGALLGSILRIDVDRQEAGKPYAIPPDNPFAGRGERVRPEIWAYGLRNVWRLGFDRLTGTLWAGDVGQDTWEEIDIIVRGGNYGWHLREGRHPYITKDARGDEQLIDPIWEYHHDVGKSITGGVVYRGTRLPELYGAYLYGDYVTSYLWALRYDGAKVTSNIQIAHPPQLPITSFGEDQAGEVYFTAFDGYIYRFRRAEQPRQPAAAPFPRRLSQTGLFTSTESLTPAPGLIPYSVNVPLWSDGAEKQRFLALPAGRSVRPSPDGLWEFPVGTVLVKTFMLDMTQGDPATRRRLETRLLVRNPRGWDGYTYLWNDPQTDATLLDTALTRTYAIRTPGGTVPQTWYFPSRADCNACHTSAVGHVLGLNTRQLNRVERYGEVSDNQLRAWGHAGVFTEPLPAPPEQLEAFPDWASPPADPPILARAYLDANCAMCHTPGGTSGTALDLRFHTPLEQTLLVDRPPTKVRLGPADSALVRPGDPEKSELVLRMTAHGAGRMPPLATSLIDRRAVDLMRQWISALTPSSPASGPAHRTSGKPATQANRQTD